METMFYSYACPLGIMLLGKIFFLFVRNVEENDEMMWKPPPPCQPPLTIAEVSTSHPRGTTLYLRMRI